MKVQHGKRVKWKLVEGAENEVFFVLEKLDLYIFDEKRKITPLNFSISWEK